MAGRYQCIWCTWDSHLGLNGTQITTRSPLLHLTMFDKLSTMYSGDAKKYAIDCMGVEDLPSIGIWMSNTMDKFNIPELYLMLGVGQKLYDALQLLTTMSEEEILANENLEEVIIFNGAPTIEMHLREMRCVNCSRCVMNWPFLLQTPHSSP